jgi:hypothetical protein
MYIVHYSKHFLLVEELHKDMNIDTHIIAKYIHYFYDLWYLFLLNKTMIEETIKEKGLVLNASFLWQVMVFHQCFNFNQYFPGLANTVILQSIKFQYNSQIILVWQFNSNTCYMSFKAIQYNSNRIQAICTFHTIHLQFMTNAAGNTGTYTKKY